MAGLNIPFDSDDEYLSYLNAVENTTIDKNLVSDTNYLLLVAKQIGLFISDVHVSRSGLLSVTESTNITIRTTDGDKDPKFVDTLKYHKYSDHVELFHEQTKRMIRILPSPTREKMFFVSFYEMGGKEYKRIASQTQLIYEGISGLESLMTTQFMMAMYHYLNNESGKEKMDFRPYYRLH